MHGSTPPVGALSLSFSTPTPTFYLLAWAFLESKLFSKKYKLQELGINIYGGRIYNGELSGLVLCFKLVSRQKLHYELR